MRRQHTITAAINITPYIDILLVLLILFMLMQPSTRYDLEARVPLGPDSHPHAFAGAIIVLSIDRGYRLKINGQDVEMAQLGARLFEIYSSRPDKNLYLRGAGELPFGAVVGLIDVAKGAGVGDIGLLGG